MKQLELKEQQEGLLLKEKRELEAKIAAYNAQDATRVRIAQLESKIAALTSEEQSLKLAHQNAVNSPFNYFCQIKSAPNVQNAHGTDFYIDAWRDTGYIVGLPAWQPPDKWQLIKCEPSNTNIDRAKQDWEAKTKELQLPSNELQRLQKILTATPADKLAWDNRLNPPILGDFETHK